MTPSGYAPFFLLVHGAATFCESPLGYYSYVDRLGSGSKDNVKEAVKRFYEEMQAPHSQYPRFPKPKTAVGMVVNGEVWLSSSRSFQEGSGGKVTTKYPGTFPDVPKEALE